MVILFIIILVVLLFFIFFINKKEKFNVIKSNVLATDQTLIPKPKDVFIGKDLENKYINYDTQFKFKLNAYRSFYLNNGLSCPPRISDSECLKRKSKNITEPIFNTKNR